jgi:hypothetical protein
MKIYIKNLNFDNIKLLQSKLEPYKISTENHIELYSEEGIFNIYKNNIFQLKVIDGEINHQELNQYNLIIDNSIIKKNQVFSIPINHSILKILEFKYKFKSNPCLFIIKCLEKYNFSFNEQHKSIEIIDFFVECNTDISNNYLMECIIELLSLLN